MVSFSITVALLLIGLYYLKFSDCLAENRGILGCFNIHVSNILDSLAEKQDVWGQFGDYVGGILNPLFSLTALFALLYTIKLQSKELHESTEQLKASAEAFRLQNNVMMRQQFEATFFQMLGLFNDVVKRMQIFKTDIKGTPCMMELFIRINKSVNHNLHKEKLKNQGLHHEEPIESIDVLYKKFYNNHSYLLNQYFLNLHNIIKFVDKSSLTEEDKKFYTNIVRTQLSDSELILLFYNCLCLDEAQEKFLPLVKQYKLLKHLDKTLLKDPAHRELLPF